MAKEGKNNTEPITDILYLQERLASMKEHYEKEISDLRKAEEEIRRSEELFRIAFKTTPDSINITRLSDGMYVSINDGFTNMFGYTETETVGRTELELNIWVNQEDRVRMLEEIGPSGKIKQFGSKFLTKNGKIISGLISASVVNLDGVPHILNVVRDITIRKNAQEALAKEQFLINALMNNITDHLYFKDLESKFIRNNRSHAHSFGLDDPEKVIGKSDFDFFAEKDARQAFNDEQTIIKTGQTIQKEEKLTRKDSSDVWYSAIKMPLRDNDGNIIGTFGISRDITEHKKAEEQLFLIANALKSINECVSITDMNDKVVFLNRAFLNTYGFTEDDLKDEFLSLIRSPNNSRELIDEILPATLKGGWHGELLNRKKDGTEFPIFLSTAIVKNNLGQPVALIGVAKDITETKKIEAALKQSEERFRSLTQSANDAIITTDGSGTILGWNKGAEVTFGFKENEILGLSLNRIIPSDYLNRHINGMKRIESDRDKHVIARTVELSGMNKDGLCFPIELSLSEWETNEGRFFTGIARNITKRKRTELENQILIEITQGVTTTSNLDELLKLIHHSLGKVVYADNCFIALHDQITNLFSFPYFVDKFDETPLPTSIGKSCSAYVFRTVKPLVLTQQIFDDLVEKGECELVGSNSPSWIGIPLQTPSKVIGVLVLQDYEKENAYSEYDVNFLVSIGSQIALAIERKKAEEEINLKNEQLQAINAEKDKFFSIVAHDLRGPLSAFVGATQILTEEIQSMAIEEIKHITLSMKASASNIYSLLENLLEWSLLKRCVLNFESEMLYLKKLVNECIDILSESARKKDIEISVDIADEQQVFADKHMLETIFRNLVSNAIKFTPIGGKVRISMENDGENTILVKVADSGIGMTAELKSKLFMISEKTSRNGTEGELSTGLGLLLCKEFIEKLGGKMWIESEVGKGSTFFFTLLKYQNSQI